MTFEHSILSFKFSDFRYRAQQLHDVSSDECAVDCRGGERSVVLKFVNHGDGDDSWLSFMLNCPRYTRNANATKMDDCGLHSSIAGEC